MWSCSGGWSGSGMCSTTTHTWFAWSCGYPWLVLMASTIIASVLSSPFEDSPKMVVRRQVVLS